MTDQSPTVVVITGCSSGFGEGAVKAFADRGYRVWGTLRDAQGRNAAKQPIQDRVLKEMQLEGVLGGTDA